MTVSTPTRAFEAKVLEEGYRFVVGVDEAGAGALAGPVVAGAVILHPTESVTGLQDSKKLSAKKREELYSAILKYSVAWAFGMATVEEIMLHGIRPANYLAMRRAIEKIEQAEYALVDAWTIPSLHIPQLGIIRGDQQVESIAAASIIAKVTRDRMMMDYHARYPIYGFDSHKGYGTRKHREAIEKHGPSPVHRMNFTLY